MPSSYRLQRMGWLPDVPDFRDFTPEHPKVQDEIGKTRLAQRAPLPPAVDLTRYCSPVEDQGPLGSCTANAAVGMYEYFERRAKGNYVDGSRLFVYKTSRDLLQWTGDHGAFLRTAMGALALFGVPPERYWPYDVTKFDDEPPAFCYAFAQDFKALKYLRLDPPGVTGDVLLAQIKQYLASEFPVMFGFTVYSSIAQADAGGRIPFPVDGEKVVGGHAVLAVGYDDELPVKNATSPTAYSGAFKIRNSWGPNWGDGGYGWLPYQYVLAGLAQDWWTMISGMWVDEGAFTATT